MFRLIRSTPICGDCTCGYDIKFDREYTVKDFIDHVLSERTNERGHIGIYNPTCFVGKHYGHPNVEYRYGKIIDDNFADDILSKQIKSASSSGGWSRMDYVLKV